MRDGSIEIWGGIECTVNRVGNRFHSQLELSGHDRRDGDLDAIAALGIRTLRYPVLWELTDPGAPTTANWEWPERRLRRLRQLGITPIVGLVHHGSGPPHTGLLEETFARRLARYAEKVARRFPWVELYTPVNEPLTTARFSALYGLWYPHARLDRAFVQVILNQCRAVALAMQAIRRVNPRARLVQTEDLGKVHSTPTLRRQAEFENERRWLTWDLLCGRVDQKQSLWAYLAGAGAREDEILWFKDNPCPPDLVGINYYVTSERYLHDRPELFQPHCRGGNGRLEYADVEAVRVPDAGTGVGVGTLLAEAWQRYQLPLALTEVHLGCSREEQMRWLFELWQAARCARDRGADFISDEHGKSRSAAPVNVVKPSGAFTHDPIEANLSPAGDRVLLNDWLPPQVGVVPKIRIGRHWFNVLWALPIGFVLAVIGVAMAQALRELPAVQDFLMRYPGVPPSAPAVTTGFPAWLRVQHFLNLLFMAFIIRSVIQVLADHPRLYWKRDCTDRQCGRRYPRLASSIAYGLPSSL